MESELIFFATAKMLYLTSIPGDQILPIIATQQFWFPTFCPLTQLWPEMSGLYFCWVIYLGDIQEIIHNSARLLPAKINRWEVESNWLLTVAGVATLLNVWLLAPCALLWFTILNYSQQWVTVTAASNMHLQYKTFHLLTQQLLDNLYVISGSMFFTTMGSQDLRLNKAFDIFPLTLSRTTF